MAKKKKITINHYWSRSKLDPSKHLNESHHVYTHVSVKRMNNYFSSVFVGICTGQEYLDGISTPGDFGQLIEKEKKYIELLLEKISYEDNNWLSLKGIQEYILVFERQILLDFMLKRLKDHIYNEFASSRFRELIEIIDWTIDSRTIFHNLKSFGIRHGDSMLLQHLSTIENLKNQTETEIKSIFHISNNNDLYEVDLNSFFRNTKWCRILDGLSDELDYILPTVNEYNILEQSKTPETFYLAQFIREQFEVIIDHLSDVVDSEYLDFANYKHDCLSNIFS